MKDGGVERLQETWTLLVSDKGWSETKEFRWKPRGNLNKFDSGFGILKHKSIRNYVRRGKLNVSPGHSILIVRNPGMGSLRVSDSLFLFNQGVFLGIPTSTPVLSLDWSKDEVGRGVDTGQNKEERDCRWNNNCMTNQIFHSLIPLRTDVLSLRPNSDLGHSSCSVPSTLLFSETTPRSLDPSVRCLKFHTRCLKFHTRCLIVVTVVVFRTIFPS